MDHQQLAASEEPPSLRPRNTTTPSAAPKTLDGSHLRSQRPVDKAKHSAAAPIPSARVELPYARPPQPEARNSPHPSQNNTAPNQRRRILPLFEATVRNSPSPLARNLSLLKARQRDLLRQILHGKSLFLTRAHAGHRRRQSPRRRRRRLDSQK
jgi:hypothetical protein